MERHAKLLRSVKADIASSTFDPRQENAWEFNCRLALTVDQMQWSSQQRVIGEASFARLRQAMSMAGLVDMVTQPADDRETVALSFRPGPEITVQNADDLIRLLIRTCRSTGFKIAWEDICFTNVNGERIEALASTTSVNDGPPEPWQLPRD